MAEHLDLDYLAEQYIELNDVDKATGEWIPPDGQRSRRCTEMFCTCCRKHLERTSLQSHVESAKHVGWIQYNLDQKAEAAKAFKRKSALIPPPQISSQKKPRGGTSTPPSSSPYIPEEKMGPPPTKIPDRDPMSARLINHLPPIARRQGLFSKAAPPRQPPQMRSSSSISDISISSTESPRQIKFVPQRSSSPDATLQDINRKVQETLNSIPTTFPPLPPGPQKSTTLEVSQPQMQPAPITEVPVRKERMVESTTMTIEQVPQQVPLQIMSHGQPLVPTTWNPMSQWQHPLMIPNTVQFSPQFLPTTVIGNSPTAVQIVYNQHGRPMLLFPL